MAIWLNVDPRSGVPLYVQIVDDVKRALAVGSLQPGDRLPTVQKLSSELTIAPNTIVKAYGELQRLGLIEARAGAGTVVSVTAPASIRETQLLALNQRIQILVQDAQTLGLGRQDLAARFAAALAKLNLPDEPGNTQAIKEVREE
jgi:GntR family transcriptional regulator